MRIYCCITAVYKETELAKSAAVSYKLIDIAVRGGRACALKRKVRKISAEGILNSLCQSFNTLEFGKVHGIIRTHFLCKFEPLGISVNSRYILYSHSP